MTRRIRTWFGTALALAGFCAGAGALEMKPLVELVRRHGVEMPPPGARLVLAHTGSWLCLGMPQSSREPGIRDFVASLLASMWSMNERPDEYWTAAQWEELRRKVRERVAKEALPEL